MGKSRRPTWLTAVCVAWIVRLATASDILEYYIMEELSPHRTVGNLLNDFGFSDRYDRDTVDSLRFSVLKQPPYDRRFFAVNETSGSIETTHRIDRELICRAQQDCVIKFDVAVKPIKYFQIIKVWVEIVDVNDNAPAFPEDRIVHRLSEATEVGSTFVVPPAGDPDSPRNGVTRYELWPTDGTFRLSVRHNSLAESDSDLRIVLHDQLDREANDRYQVTLYAVDGGDPPRTGSIQVDIAVLDANDNRPEFEQRVYDVRAPESTPVGSVLVQVRARDRDEALNADVRYKFSRHTAHEYATLFSIRPDNGKIFLQRALDFESGHVHVLSVTAVDRGPDSLPAHVNVVVRVDDINDNAPLIAVNSLTETIESRDDDAVAADWAWDGASVATVNEGSPPATFVAHVSVSDADKTGDNGQFRCAIDDSQNFRLIQMYQQTTTPTSTTLSVASGSSSSGSVIEYQLITGNVVFDREQRDFHQVVITCRDFGKTPLQSSVDIRVIVVDLNDNAPVFPVTSYAAEVTENGELGTEVLRVVATDADAEHNGAIMYRLDADVTVHSLLTIDSATGIITSRTPIDHETTSGIKFNVVAEDGGRPSRSSTVRVSVSVADVDDERPQFHDHFYAFQIAENQPAGTEVGRVTAVDRDAPPYDEFLYAISDESVPFEVDADSGRLITRQLLDRETMQSHQFFVVAVSKSGETLSSAAVTVGVGDVNDNRPSFATSNWTLTVSSSTPPGHVVAGLAADDPDSPANSRLIYSVESGNERRLFSVDASSGELSVASDALSQIDFDELLLCVTVQQVGDDQIADRTSLRIVVSRDIPFSPASDVDTAPVDDTWGTSMSGVSGLEDEGTVVVLAVTLAVVLVAITIVVVVFVCVRSSDQRRHGMDVSSNATPADMKRHSVTEKTLLNGTVKSNGCLHAQNGTKYVPSSSSVRPCLGLYVGPPSTVVDCRYPPLTTSTVPAKLSKRASATKPVVVFIKDSRDCSVHHLDSDEENTAANERLKDVVGDITTSFSSPRHTSLSPSLGANGSTGHVTSDRKQFYQHVASRELIVDDSVTVGLPQILTSSSSAKASLPAAVPARADAAQQSCWSSFNGRTFPRHAGSSGGDGAETAQSGRRRIADMGLGTAAGCDRTGLVDGSTSPAASSLRPHSRSYSDLRADDQRWPPPPPPRLDLDLQRPSASTCGRSRTTSTSGTPRGMRRADMGGDTVISGGRESNWTIDRHRSATSNDTNQPRTAVTYISRPRPSAAVDCQQTEYPVYDF